jgi:hypothetical protein
MQQRNIAMMILTPTLLEEINMTTIFRTQRDAMKFVWNEVGRNEGRAITMYAKLERDGKVARNSNRSRYTSEQYARALLNDARKHKRNGTPWLDI